MDGFSPRAQSLIYDNCCQIPRSDDSSWRTIVGATRIALADSKEKCKHLEEKLARSQDEWKAKYEAADRRARENARIAGFRLKEIHRWENEVNRAFREIGLIWDDESLSDCIINAFRAADARFTDLQQHAYAGHIVKCPTCGCNLTSLLLCPECGTRYVITPAGQDSK
jgi:hypothetical protein